MSQTVNPPLSYKILMQNDQEVTHFTLTLKIQFAKVFYHYIGPQNTERIDHKVPTSPPPIDPIPYHEAQIYMMSLMDAPENSDEGIQRVF